MMSETLSSAASFVGSRSREEIRRFALQEAGRLAHIHNHDRLIEAAKEIEQFITGKKPTDDRDRAGNVPRGYRKLRPNEAAGSFRDQWQGEDGSLWVPEEQTEAEQAEPDVEEVHAVLSRKREFIPTTIEGVYRLVLRLTADVAKMRERSAEQQLEIARLTGRLDAMGAKQGYGL
jgi:hypothetical protein